MKLKKPLTKKGFDRLAAEHTHLWKKKRPQVVDAIATAAAEGDRSENAEYIYGKKKLREVDRRIRYLESILKDVQIVQPEKIASDHVTFGCFIEIEIDNGETVVTKTLQLVGDGELASDGSTVNWTSPLGKKLMAKKAGEEFDLVVPGGERFYKVISFYVK